MTKVRLLSVLLAVALLASAAAAQEKITFSKKTEVPSAWINFVDGRVFFQDFEKVERDKAVNPGDEINTQNGRVEVELGEGNWIRLDHNTRVVFNEIQKNAATLSLWEGSLYLELKGGAAVKVRSSQEEHLFQDKGAVRVDVDKNGTQVFNNPRVADGFDGWSRDRDQALAQTESGGAYPYYRPYFGGWAFSPFWPWSSYDWYMGFHPFWPYYDPFLWSSYAWPSWYFGWNPFWAWDSFYFGFGYPYFGYYGGYYGLRGGLYGRNVIRRDQVGAPRGAVVSGQRQLRQIRSGSTALGSSGGLYPSRLTRAIRPTSSATVSRGSGTSRTVTSRSSSGRVSSGSVARSFGGSSGRSFGGGRMGGGGGRRR